MKLRHESLTQQVKFHLLVKAFRNSKPLQVWKERKVGSAPLVYGSNGFSFHQILNKTLFVFFSKWRENFDSKITQNHSSIYNSIWNKVRWYQTARAWCALFQVCVNLIFLPVVCSEALHGGSETSCEDQLVELGVCQPWPEQAHVPTFPFVLLVQVKTINSEDCHLVLRSTSLKEKILHLSQSTNQTIYWLLLKDSVAARKAKG